ncbi:MAG: NusG domain II-containing protein [Lachnospiraceae bacterium]|nr:NusG domain II-containing protein [Lachnospiraceae bacterium]
MNIPNKDFIHKLKNDIALIGALLVVSFFLFLLPHLRNENQSFNEVVVLQSGEEIGRYKLSENKTVTIKGPDDQSYNLLLINEGDVKVTDADCPDQLCIRQKSIKRNGESIICLPHQLVILIDSPEESDIDAITN